MTSVEPVTVAAVLLWAGLLLVIGLLCGAADPRQAIDSAWRRQRRRLRRMRRRRRQATRPAGRVLPLVRPHRPRSDPTP